MNRKQTISLIIAVTGVALAIVGYVLFFAVFPRVFENKIAEEMYIQKGTGEAFERFETLPIGLQFRIYLFEVTNDTNFDGTRIDSLTFRERGPYVYDERRRKFDIEFSANGERVSFREHKSYVFNRQLSSPGVGDENDTVRIVHPGLAMQPDRLAIFGEAITDVTVMDTVANLAFLGSAPLIGQAMFKCENCDSAIKVIDTGKADIRRLGQTLSYDGQEGKSNFWSKTAHRWRPAKCDQISGTDGTQFHPTISSLPSESLLVFESMACRTMELSRNPAMLADVAVESIETFRFVADEDVNFGISLENECFCYEPNADRCPAGFLNIRNCPPADLLDLDLIITQPFYYSNRELLNGTGLERLIAERSDRMNTLNYGTIVDVEPNTGLVLSAKKRFQLNVLLKKASHPLLKNLSRDKMLAPLMWIEEYGAVDAANADKLRTMVLKPKAIGTGVLLALIALGAIMAIGGGSYALFCR